MKYALRGSEKRKVTVVTIKVVVILNMLEV